MLPVVIVPGSKGLHVPLPKRATEVELKDELKEDTFEMGPYELLFIWDKDYYYVTDGNGMLSRPIPLSEEEAEALRFICKVGEFNEGRPMTAQERAAALFKGGVVPTQKQVAQAIEAAEQAIISNGVGGNGRLRKWSSISSKLFEGTKTTEERSRRISRCTNIPLLEAMAADPLLGRQYRKRCQMRVNRLRRAHKSQIKLEDDANNTDN